ncbi:MAG: DUF7504 family protein [Haloferacaceae archaeon]
MDTAFDHVLDGRLPPATHILGVSPPMLGLHHLTDQYLVDGLTAGEGCVVVTTDRNASSIVSAVDGQLTDAELETLGIVDVTSTSPEPDAIPYHLEVVNSPAELTGIGIAINKLFKRFQDRGVNSYRLVIDSVSTLLVYGEFARVYKFLHTVLNQVGEADGTSVSLLAGDTGQNELAKLEALYDDIIEVRNDDQPVYRVHGRHGSEEWNPFPTALPHKRETAHTKPATSSAITATDIVQTIPPSPDSLQAIIEGIANARLTLTLCNVQSGTEDARRALEPYFERLNVTIRTATLSTELPTDIALLHRGADTLAISGISDLYTAISADLFDRGGMETDVGRPDVLEHARRNTFTVTDGSKLELVRISRLIETRALRIGDGTLHTGFQRLSRINDDFDTWHLYEEIANAGVTVHLYGEPGEVPEPELFTLHTATDGELPESWFVVYDGNGEDAQKMMELCQESDPERYRGFWTHDPAVTDIATSYLETTYVGDD